MDECDLSFLDYFRILIVTDGYNSNNTDMYDMLRGIRGVNISYALWTSDIKTIMRHTKPDIIIIYSQNDVHWDILRSHIMDEIVAVTKVLEAADELGRFFKLDRVIYMHCAHEEEVQHIYAIMEAWGKHTTVKTSVTREEYDLGLRLKLILQGGNFKLPKVLDQIVSVPVLEGSCPGLASGPAAVSAHCLPPVGIQQGDQIPPEAKVWVREVEPVQRQESVLGSEEEGV